MKAIQPDDVQACADAVSRGGIVVVPTERWYMVACDAGSRAATERIYRAKGRPRDKALVLVLPSTARVSEYFDISSAAEALIESLWPGHLALRLRWRRAADGRRFDAVGEEVALVTRQDGFLGALADASDVWIAATLANISGTPDSSGKGPSLSFEEAREFSAESGLQPERIVDGGISPAFQHMTIVSAENLPLEIVRDGLVSREAIELALHQSPST